MPTQFTAKMWQHKAWEAITKVLARTCPHEDFNCENHPYAEYLWQKLITLEVPHTYEEYLDNVMALLHSEAEMLERAKISVRALRFSKICS